MVLACKPEGGRYNCLPSRIGYPSYRISTVKEGQEDLYFYEEDRVLIFGIRSNLQALIDAVDKGRIPAEISLVISDRPNT